MEDMHYPSKDLAEEGYDILAMFRHEIRELYYEKKAYRKLARRLIKKIQRTDLANDKRAELKSEITEKDMAREGLKDLFKTKGGNNED